MLYAINKESQFLCYELAEHPSTRARFMSSVRIPVISLHSSLSNSSYLLCNFLFYTLLVWSLFIWLYTFVSCSRYSKLWRRVLRNKFSKCVFWHVIDIHVIIGRFFIIYAGGLYGSKQTSDNKSVMMTSCWGRTDRIPYPSNVARSSDQA